MSVEGIMMCVARPSVENFSVVVDVRKPNRWMFHPVLAEMMECCNMVQAMNHMNHTLCAEVFRVFFG